MTLNDDHWEDLCEAVVARDWDKVDIVLSIICDRQPPSRINFPGEALAKAKARTFT